MKVKYESMCKFYIDLMTSGENCKKGDPSCYDCKDFELKSKISSRASDGGGVRIIKCKNCELKENIVVAITEDGKCKDCGRQLINLKINWGEKMISVRDIDDSGYMEIIKKLKHRVWELQQELDKYGKLTI